MSPTIVTLANWLAERLVAGSLQAGPLVALAWLTSRSRVALSASMQTAIWWVVMLRIVLVFAPLPTVPIPILPAATPPATSVVLVADVGPDAAPSPMSASHAAAAPGWQLGLIGLWLMGVAWHAGRLLIAWRRTQSAVRRSLPSDDDAGTARELAAALGLLRPPAVRISADVVAPQVVGLRHPVVLMPAGASLTPHERLMAIGHECMHVKRRDLAFGWVPAIAERLFFFHPLVRLAAGEYVTLREAACDAALVRALEIAPDDYGRLLVRFGINRQRVAWSAGGASASITSLRRRLDMLQQLSRRSRRAVWVVAAVMVVTLVPGHLVARATLAAPMAQPQPFMPADVTPSQPLPPATHAAVLQEAPIALSSADPAPGADQRAVQPERETPRVADLLREIAEVERQFQEAQERDAVDAEQEAREASAVARRQQEMEKRERTREIERALELTRREQDGTSPARDELRAYISGASAQALKQHLEELSRQLETLAEMQRQLQRESDQLKRELDAF